MGAPRSPSGGRHDGPETAMTDRLLRPAAGAIYDQLHPKGWRWDNLTSGEQAEERAKIEPIVDAIDALGFDFVRRTDETDDSVAERERRWFFVRAAGPRRFGWWRQRLAGGGGFVAVDLGHYRLGRRGPQ